MRQRESERPRFQKLCLCSGLDAQGASRRLAAVLLHPGVDGEDPGLPNVGAFIIYNRALGSFIV